jgi:uncharacterized membrane protein
MRSFRERYGAGPLHLLALLASFAVAAYALSRSLELAANPERLLLWMGGSIVAHDLVLLPFYAALGVIAALLLIPAGRGSRVRIAALNHLRFPALASGLLLLVWYPLIAGPAERTFMRNTGLTKDVYLERWIILSAALFVLSAALFALRYRGLRRAGAPVRPGLRRTR